MLRDIRRWEGIEGGGEVDSAVERVIGQWEGTKGSGEGQRAVWDRWEGCRRVGKVYCLIGNGKGMRAVARGVERWGYV